MPWAMGPLGFLGPWPGQQRRLPKNKYKDLKRNSGRGPKKKYRGLNKNSGPLFLSRFFICCFRSPMDGHPCGAVPRPLKTNDFDYLAFLPLDYRVCFRGTAKQNIKTYKEIAGGGLTCPKGARRTHASGDLGVSLACGRTPHAKLHRRVERTVRRWPLQ